MKHLARLTLALAAMAASLGTPLGAQVTGGGNRGGRPPAVTPNVARPDTGKKGFALDFQDQDIRTVLSALAEAGNVNLAFGNLPARRVTLRMGQSATAAEITSMIKGIAEANDLRVSENGSLMQISPPPTPLTPQQQQAATATQNVLNIYTYRLKHASATVLAPVLQSVFTATGGRGNVTTIQTPQGTLQFNTPAGVNAPAGRGGQALPGRGGGGGGQPQPTPDVVGTFGGTTGSAAGGANINLNLGAGGRGGAAAQAIQQQLLQQFQQAAGGLSSAAGEVRIVGEESSNSLLIRATATDYALLQQVLQSVDLRPLQVLIEVTIAEVVRSNDLNYGISGSANRKGDTASFAFAGSARDFILALTRGGGAVNYNLALNALQTRGDVKVLSLPVIIAQNNKQAVLNVGEQRPFVQVNQSVTTGTVPTTVQTIQYLPVATTLTITPTINPDGYVNMAVSQTDNSATNEVEFNAPIISQREATTQVFLRDGQTTVIGGLAGKSTRKTTSGIPILSKIPLIGGLLFGNTQKTTSTSELFLFLTPHIISSDEDIDKLREAVKDGTELLKELPLDPRIIPKADTLVYPLPAAPVRPDSAARRGGGR